MLFAILEHYGRLHADLIHHLRNPKICRMIVLVGFCFLSMAWKVTQPWRAERPTQVVDERERARIRNNTRVCVLCQQWYWIPAVIISAGTILLVPPVPYEPILWAFALGICNFFIHFILRDFTIERYGIAAVAAGGGMGALRNGFTALTVLIIRKGVLDFEIATTVNWLLGLAALAVAFSYFAEVIVPADMKLDDLLAIPWIRVLKRYEERGRSVEREGSGGESGGLGERQSLREPALLVRGYGRGPNYGAIGTRESTQ
ncbi:hypothetical protein M011DRAFT_480589 [Sporormia fimetaria CBS 119925]|uniref:Uncharacterized protein n=1 Tax=Sporormia fimetaria CBS 119925 TaxID=1340428 RepID=A0A6A6V399_9PLEO|nr:hypothetical protein M011DRAFT_480589 [Sporormia fimetaria CBS 119925]